MGWRNGLYLWQHMRVTRDVARHAAQRACLRCTRISAPRLYQMLYLMAVCSLRWRLTLSCGLSNAALGGITTLRY